MRLPQFIKDEPIAAIGLVVALVLGALSSPVLVSWYIESGVQAWLKYTVAEDGRCLPSRVVVRNTAKSTATNVRIYFKVGSFGDRGDIHAYYSGNEPFSRVNQNVDYVEKSGYVLIKQFPPGVRQEFVYLEEYKEPSAVSTRARLLAKKDPSVFDFPQITLITSDQGKADIEIDRRDCT